MATETVRYIDERTTSGYREVEEYGLKTHFEEILVAVQAAQERAHAIPQGMKSELQRMGVDVETPYVLYYSSTSFTPPGTGAVEHFPPVLVSPDGSEAVAVPHYVDHGYFKEPRVEQVLDTIAHSDAAKEGRIPTVVLFLDTADFAATGEKPGNYHGGYADGPQGRTTVAQFHAEPLLKDLDFRGAPEKLVAVSDAVTVYQLRPGFRRDGAPVANLVVFPAQMAKRQPAAV